MSNNEAFSIVQIWVNIGCNLHLKYLPEQTSILAHNYILLDMNHGIFGTWMLWGYKMHSDLIKVWAGLKLRTYLQFCLH